MARVSGKITKAALRRGTSVPLIAAALALGLVGACSKREVVLQGERLDLRAGLGAPLNAAGNVAPNASGPKSATQSQATPIRLPKPVNHASWPQRGGSVTHHVSDPAFSTTPQRLWAVSIGAPNSRKYRIAADPVVADKRIFTLDARAGVQAHTLDGKPLWSVDITPPSDKAGEASGGGLAVAGGTLYVTSGYGELVALDVKTGQKRWVQRLEAVATGAPAVRGGMVYVVSRDSRAWALDARDGRIRWELPGVPAAAVMAGGAAPAVTDQFAILPFGSGEVTAAFRKGGMRMWGAPVAGARRGRAYASVIDITGDPVVIGKVVYAANAAGRVVALDLASGERIWTAREGAYGPVWPTGGSVFLISDEDQLVRLDAKTGVRIWAVDMPYFTAKKPKRHKGIVAHFGPIVAGGRLLVASSDGLIRVFDPASGALLTTYDLPGGAASAPIVVNGTLYVVSAKGQLNAYR